MNKSFKCLIAAVFVVGFSAPSVSHAGKHLGTSHLGGDHRCVHTGHTWLSGGRVYGMAESQCNRTVVRAVQGVGINAHSPYHISRSEGTAYANTSAKRITSMACLPVNYRTAWGMQDKYYAYSIFGRPLVRRSYGSSWKTIDYRKC